jgi:hypothetical protein
LLMRSRGVIGIIDLDIIEEWRLEG